MRIATLIKTSPDWPFDIISSNRGKAWTNHNIPTKTEEKKMNGLN